MRQGLSYFHETIFEGLPKFLRRIDTALKNIGQPMLPLEHCLFKFGSWCVPLSTGSKRNSSSNVMCFSASDVTFLVANAFGEVPAYVLLNCHNRLSQM